MLEHSTECVDSIEHRHVPPGHPVIVTPGKARGPAWGRAGGKPDLSARLAVIDSLLDNFEVAS